MDKNKLVLPISILLGCLILGGFYYMSQVNKQQSIEKQQQIDLQAKKEADQVKAEQDKLKAEQDKKEYIAKRKTDCLAIYKTESDKWNNTTRWEYHKPREGVGITDNPFTLFNNDTCEIFYKDKEGEEFGREF